MKETLVIEAKPRTARGKGAAGRLRRAGRVPAVVYGEGREAMALELSAHDFERMLHRHRGEHMIVDLAIAGGGTRKALLQEVQRDALTGRVLHVDFHEISMSKKLRLEVPLVLVGTPIGVSQQGGVLDHLVRQIEIECLPTDIPEQIVVDVSALEVGRHLSVKDIQLDPARYTVITAPDIAIAAVFMPKSEEEVPAAAAAEGAAAAEPEVLTEKKAEERAAAQEGQEEKASKEKGGKEKEKAEK